MDFLVDDEDTKVVSIYIEGVKNADKFAAVLKKAAEKRKPVVILKPDEVQKVERLLLLIQEVCPVPMHPLMQY